MTSLQIIEPDPSRADWLPYAPAVRIPHGATFVYLPGAVRAEDGEPPMDIVEQTRAVMRRHTEALAAHGLGWTDVVHVFEFLTDMRETGPVHITMDEWLHGWRPANTLVGVNALARAGARFELDVIAVRGPVADEGEPALWMSGATAIPLYHKHPHVPEQCVLPDDIGEQTRRVLTTFDELLAFTGRGWADVAKCSLFLTDLRDLAAFRELYHAHLGDAAPPVSLVGINHLSAPGARLELEITTVGDEDPDFPVFLPAVSAGDAAQAVDALAAQLESRGLARSAVAKVLVHVTDGRDVNVAGRSVAGAFPGAALTIVQVDGLPVSGARVQLDGIAHRG